MAPSRHFKENTHEYQPLCRQTGFIALLRDKTGVELLDLPASAQWEYSCRAGATMHYNDYTLNAGVGSNADADLNNLGWYAGNNIC